jgi:hypothetical protein
VRELARRFMLIVELHRRGINVRHLGRGDWCSSACGLFLIVCFFFFFFFFFSFFFLFFFFAVRFISTSRLVRMLILSECVYRVLKNDLRARMRLLLQQLPLPRVSPFQQLLCDTYNQVKQLPLPRAISAVDTYNQVLGSDDVFWRSVIVLLRKKFGERLMQGSRVDPLSHVKQLARGVSDVVKALKDDERKISFKKKTHNKTGCCRRGLFS